MADQLTIGGGVGERWTTTRNTIDKALRQLDPEVEYRLGGGTVLATQWNHRTSYDIDIQVSPVDLEGLDKPEFEWFRTAVENWGGTPRFYRRTGLYEIAFGVGPRAPKMQLWRHEAEFKSGHRTLNVNGEPVLVLSNSQILRGKIERAQMALPRDLFDIVTASRRDPESLSAAANAISQERVIELSSAWRLNHGRIGRNAREQIDGLPGQSGLEPYALAGAAGHALENACYRDLRIRTAGQRIQVEASTYGGLDHNWTTTLENAEQNLEARGINAHLERKIRDPAALQRAAERICATGPASVTLYWEVDTEIKTWLGDSTASSGPDSRRRPM